MIDLSDDFLSLGPKGRHLFNNFHHEMKIPYVNKMTQFYIRLTTLPDSDD